jgi:hypothetical protein
MDRAGFKELIATAQAEFQPEKLPGPKLSTFAQAVSWGSDYKPPEYKS